MNAICAQVSAGEARGAEEDFKVEHFEDSQLEPPLLGLHLPPASPESQIQAGSSTAT